MNEQSGKWIIKLENVCKQYMDGNVNALNGVNLEIFEGDFLVIMGISGSGKSTLFNMIATLDMPTEGKVWYSGEICKRLGIANRKKRNQENNHDRTTASMNDKEKSLLRSKIGFIFQEFNLISAINALENIEIGLTVSDKDEEGNKITSKQIKEKSIQMLEKLDLIDRINHRPMELSGGQKQRVAIARALVKPNLIIILADEPTGNVDSKNGALILEHLKSLNDEGHTILIVTHNEEIAKQYGKKVITMQDGMITSININGVVSS